jgi:hypothetical protein
MAPHVGFDTDQIKDKCRKDLLYLLEGVSKDILPQLGRTVLIFVRCVARRISCLRGA